MIAPEQIPMLMGLAAGLLVGIALSALVARLMIINRAQVVSSQLADQHALEIAQIREQKIAIEARLQARDDEFQSLQQQVQQRQRELDNILQQAQQLSSDQAAQIASLKTELQQQQTLAEEKIQLLQDAKQQLTQEFQLLAGRIFEEKSERFNTHSKQTLDTALSPLREQLTDFKKKVEDVYDKDSKERTALGLELSQLKQLNQKMTDEALNLTRALKGDNKTQGNWGEVILERVLEESGLHKGREYETQVALKSDDGQRRNPDVVVRLPDNKDIIIDAKVSLVHYERYCNSDEQLDRDQALKEHINSVRSHINALSFKDYEALEGIRTLDFVFIFVPIESAFMAAFEHDQAMFRDAYEKNIIVVSPTTLLATLRTVQSIWRYERQNKNAEEIARQAGAMHDKFIGFVNDLDKIAEHLSRASQAHDNAMNKLSAGKGNLVGSTQRLEKLGAKVKKAMPASVLQAEGDELEDEELLLESSDPDKA